MNTNFSPRICIAVLILFLSANIAYSQDRYELNEGWKCAPLSSVKENGEAISLPNFTLTNWLPATVPGTVLTSLLDNKKIPDPFYGMNNERIPDIYTTGRDYYTYWFVKNFKETYPQKGRQVWLQFRGVNYGCNVYLNGQRLNDTTHTGMFLRQAYNITPYLNKNGSNRLAVIVYPPDPVGNPNGGQGGDGMIAKNITHQYVAGWDWIQPIRDRNTGIWDKVYIERTGAINLKNPHIITLVPGVRKPGNMQQPAIIKVSAELENTGSLPVSGLLQYAIDGNKISEKVTIPAGSTTKILLPDLTLKNPRLWWPNGYGPQELYQTELQFLENGKTISDKEKITFGIREIQREWNTVTSSSQFSVNGQKIFIKGGNWIISDAMLRFSAERYDAEIRFHRDMNLNLIRIWGGALLERPEFFEACDRYGILVFQDFWITGDCNGRWNDRMKLESRQTRRKYPDDHSLFIRSLADGVKMIRNHPSLAIWCGGNEFTPPEDILKVIKDSLLPELDGTRIFFDYSNSDSMSKNILRGGGDGPYTIQPTDTFFKFRTYPFNSEIGSVGLGDYESLQRFIPAQNMTPPEYTPPADAKAKPLTKTDSVWDYHKYIGYNQYISLFGPVANARDFATKAQVINYDQYRSLIEGFSAHMWDWYTGVIIWKTQNPWTALRGQMYDYYLDPNACLYGLRKGSELLHPLYNPVDGSLMIINNSFDDYKNLKLLAEAYDMDGKKMNIQELPVSATSSSVQKLISIKNEADNLRAEKGIFLALRLQDEKGAAISENIYWLPDASGMYSGLQQLKAIRLKTSVKKITANKIEVTLTNPSLAPVSFFNRVSLINGQNKKRILPVFYSDNYISILPGKTKKVIIEYNKNLSAAKPMVAISGWNSKEEYYSIP